MVSIIAPLIAGWFVSTCLATSGDQNGTSYSPCPIIGAYYPPPIISKSSDAFKSLVDNFTKTLEELIQHQGSPEFGSITPQTTSFSVVLFSGDNSSVEDPSFFEYYYTAPKSGSEQNLTAETRMPVGDLTMVFTVYAWLAEMGDQWDSPITEFLPELNGTAGSMTIPWESITIGALAGQLSGLPRESYACVIGKPCDYQTFVQEITSKLPIFLPDTTPIVSYAAFQLLAFALQSRSQELTKEDRFEEVLKSAIITPLHLPDTALIDQNQPNIFGSSHLNVSQIGEPAALSLVTSSKDLACTGNSILSSRLISEASTHRWLHSTIDTSNLRNGVGRPWEVYRAGQSAISPILDILTKGGSLGPYSSYFGLSTDFNVGFAILAHDPSVPPGTLDLNVYADVVSQAISSLLVIAAEETAAKFAGKYQGVGNSSIALQVTENGPGLEVQTYQSQGTDMRQLIAKQLGILESNLDFRLYPTNVRSSTAYQFAAIFQDNSAPVDAGTPTCITWEELGAADGVAYSYMFGLGSDGVATTISAQGSNVTLTKA